MASKEYEVLMQALLKAVQEASKENAASNATGVPVGISNRHIHLSQADLDQLFGAGYQLTPMKELSQPGQFACKETVTICGPKGAIEKVRVLGPVRKETQIEIVAGDCFKLGVKAPAKLSGDLAGTPGITVVGPKGSVQTAQGLSVISTWRQQTRRPMVCRMGRSSRSAWADCAAAFMTTLPFV